MKASDKDKKLERFTASQNQMIELASRVPKGWVGWDYIKTNHYKKVVKGCDKFIKLKPTNDDKAFIRLDNHLSDLKRFYGGEL